MLFGENLHSAIKHEHIVDAGFLCAFALIVDNAGFGEIIVFIATLRDAIRQVDVLAIHEKGLVKQADLVHRFLAHEHKGTSQNLHFVGFVVGEMAHVIPCKTLAMREEFGQAEHLVERRLRRRQTAFGFRQKLSLAVYHLHAEATRLRVTIHESEAFAESVVFNYRVGIQQEHILPRGNPDGLVVGATESYILLVGDDLHLGKLLRQHFQ